MLIWFLGNYLAGFISIFLFFYCRRERRFFVSQYSLLARKVKEPFMFSLVNLQLRGGSWHKSLYFEKEHAENQFRGLFQHPRRSKATLFCCHFKALRKGEQYSDVCGVVILVSRFGAQHLVVSRMQILNNNTVREEGFVINVLLSRPVNLG